MTVYVLLVVNMSPTHHPVTWDCRISWLHPCGKGKPLPPSETTCWLLEATCNAWERDFSHWVIHVPATKWSRDPEYSILTLTGFDGLCERPDPINWPFMSSLTTNIIKARLYSTNGSYQLFFFVRARRWWLWKADNKNYSCKIIKIHEVNVNSNIFLHMKLYIKKNNNKIAHKGWYAIKK